MRTLELIYRSPVGRLLSALGRSWTWLIKPRMIYGFVDPGTGVFRKFVRISTSTDILHPSGLEIEDHVWLFHHCVIDASNGVRIGEGCQIGAWVGIFSHGSENSIRLLGRGYVDIPAEKRLGYTRGRVEIGPYTFIGAGSMILPGVRIGKGCIIAPGSVITKDVDDYAIFIPPPGRVIARTLDKDAPFFADHDFSNTYYDKKALELVKALASHRSPPE